MEMSSLESKDISGARVEMRAYLHLTSSGYPRSSFRLENSFQDNWKP